MDEYLLIWEDGTIEQKTEVNPPPHDFRLGVQEGVLTLVRYTFDEYQEYGPDGKWHRV